MPCTRRCLLASLTSIALAAGVHLTGHAASAAEPGTQAIVDAARATVVDLAAWYGKRLTPSADGLRQALRAAAR